MLQSGVHFKSSISTLKPEMVSSTADCTVVVFFLNPLHTEALQNTAKEFVSKATFSELSHWTSIVDDGCAERMLRISIVGSVHPFQHCPRSEIVPLLHLVTLHKWPIRVTHPIQPVTCLIYCPLRDNAGPLKCPTEEPWMVFLPKPIKSFSFIFILNCFVVGKFGCSCCEEFQSEHFTIFSCAFRNSLMFVHYVSVLKRPHYWFYSG